VIDIKIIILGAIQGLTEFLPVSSSAHLSFFQMLFGYENMLGYDIVLHAATLFALLLFFRKSIVSLTLEWLYGFFKSEYRDSEGWRYGWAVLCGTIVTAMIALPLKPFVEKAVESPVIIAAGLIFTSVLLWYVGNLKARKCEISMKCGLFVGLMQGIAVMPGISRSGATIFMGRFAGLHPEEAFRFSFLISIPAILGATLLEILNMYKVGEVTLPPCWWLGALLAFSLGWSSLIILRRFVISGLWKCFSAYCSFIAILMVLFQLLS
jgi:undecaprenyl-diphosphatase